jgi:hypothetical protein
MPWSRRVEEGTHVVIARLAHYLHQYAETRRPQLKAIISKSTLTRYSNYRAVLDHHNPKAKEYGPRRLDVFLKLVERLGHDPAVVLKAAIESRSAEEMAFIISENARASQNVPPQPVILKRPVRTVRIRRPRDAA